jgi:chitodextrinase
MHRPSACVIRRMPLLLALAFALSLIMAMPVLARGVSSHHRAKPTCRSNVTRRNAVRHLRGLRRARSCVVPRRTSAKVQTNFLRRRPSAPANLAARPGDQLASLSWTASTRAVGYDVFRSGAKVAQVTGTSFTDTGLVDGTSYPYYVVAYGVVGTLSPRSSTVSTTPIDKTPPTVPGNLSATGGNAQVSLLWNASTDNVAVAGYDVYRNGAQITQTAGATFMDTGLADGTSYSYSVAAYDAAGNVSAPSNAVSATPSVSAGVCPWLRASGNHIVVAGTNQPALLHGVNIMEAEWTNNVNWESAAIPSLASAWHGNIVIHGFASDPVNSNDTSYLHLLDHYVALTRANHEYVVFSWRSDTQNGAQPDYPDSGAQSALAILAGRYRGDSHVMFSLQVEPHGVTWSFVQPIFGQMVDAIRQAAAPYDPLIFIPGVAWGKDISGAITDPVQRGNIVYQSHPYTSSANFQQYFGSAYRAGLPVFIGEFGPTAYMSMADIQNLLALTRQNGIGWAAWGFEPDATPSLIDASLNPANPFGTTVRTAMLTTPTIPGCG